MAQTVHAPIQLNDGIENLPAHSAHAIGFRTPYDGTVTVSLEVTRGNPIQVFLTDEADLSGFDRPGWLGPSQAGSNKSYKRAGRLRSGAYYLVVRDLSLGILFSSSSDVAVRVRLEP